MSYCDWDTTDELCLRYHDGLLAPPGLRNH